VKIVNLGFLIWLYSQVTDGTSRGNGRDFCPAVHTIGVIAEPELNGTPCVYH